MPRLIGLAVAALLVALVHWLTPDTFGAVERAAGDLTWRVGASSDRAERRVVIVDIDEHSLSQVGPWPWPRATIADLSRKLAQAGAGSQIYDIVFPDPREGDAELVAAWRASSVTAGQIFSIDSTVRPRVGELGGALAMPGCPGIAPQSFGYIANAAAMGGSGVSIGHLTPRVEHDGVIRKVPALVCHQGRAYPALALAALWRLSQANGGDPTPMAPDWRAESPATSGLSGGFFAPTAVLTSAALPGLVVPVDAQGDMRVPYRLGRNGLASVSASEVLAGRADPALLKGAVVLIGATAFGLGDTKATPQAAVASGLEVQAQLLVGLLDGRLPFTPAGSPVIQWLLGFAALVALYGLARSPSASAVKRLPVAGALLAVAFAAAAMFSLWYHDIWLPWTVPALMALTGSVLLSTIEHGLTRAQRERLSAHLGAYLPAPVARRLMRTDPSGSIQVEQRPVSVLVADIRNFSAFVAHRAPAETTTLLHAFCCIAVDVVESHGGVVENVVGDSVLAVWNAYSDCPDHAHQSMQAAQELVRATRSLFEPRRPVHEADVVQPLALGVGVETGMALVGSFGPLRRRAHAALGEPVSVATRLQHMTQELSYPVLVGPQLTKALPEGSTELVGEYLLEGLTRHYAVYAPVGWAQLLSDELTWSAPAQSAAETDVPYLAHGQVQGRGLAGPFGKPFATSSEL